MDKNQLKNEIKSIIRESLREMSLRNHVRKIVSEEVNRLFESKAINEAGEGEGEGNANIKRKAVMNLLKDDKYDHAYLAYQLWHPKDDNEKDTYRSLFSKKATGKPDNDGAVRSFTDDEITKLYELIRNK
jgi:hypothetical protein